MPHIERVIDRGDLPHRGGLNRGELNRGELIGEAETAAGKERARQHPKLARHSATLIGTAKTADNRAPAGRPSTGTSVTVRLP